MRKLFRGSLAALAVTGLGTAAVAAPATDPPPPVFVSPTGHSVWTFDLAAADGGRAVVAWAAEDAREVTRLWVSDRAPGGSFGSPSGLSHPDRDAWLPRTAVTPGGTELVAWVEERSDSHRYRVLVASRRPGAASFVTTVLGRRVHSPSQLSIATGAQGAAAATWVQETDDHIGRVAVAIRTPAGKWREPELVTDTRRTVSNPRVALDGGGNATVVWDRAPPPHKPTIERAAPRVRAARQKGDGEVRAAYRPRGGTFGRAQVLSNPRQQATDAFLAQNASGDAVVVWRTLPSRRDFYFRIAFAYRKGHGRFGRHHLIGSQTHGLSYPRAAVDPEGGATLVWGSTTHPGTGCECVRIFRALRPPGGPPGEPVPVSERGVWGPEIAADGVGNALVVWSPEAFMPANAERVKGRFVGADGVLGPERHFSSVGQEVEGENTVALTDDGRALVGWTRYSGGENGHSTLEVVDTAVP